MKQIEKAIKDKSNPKKAKILQRFFKTGDGQYGAGDVFLGIVVPEQRKIAKQFRDLPMAKIERLLNSKIHEKRLISLFILIDQYKRADKKTKKKIYRFYLDHTSRVNNWDLVDLSAPNIVGDYLLDKDRRMLYRLAKSKSLWEKRISILATFRFIKENQFKDSLKIAKLLLKDKHDLIHKSTGWMLREVGKRSQKTLEEFLIQHYKNMPRTMLRYSIEKFDKKKKGFYMKK